MSNRLDSLNSRKGKSDSKQSLKFKPKVVARKSKEERTKDAQAQVKEEPSPYKPNVRGRGSGRGRGRGGRADYSGTHVVASGPLMSGSVSIGNPVGTSNAINRSIAQSHSSTPEIFQSLKLKDGYKSKSLSPEDSDSEDDNTRIDMNREYQFADEDTVLFPVRAKRIEEGEDKTPIEPSKEPTPHPGSAYHSTANTPVKSEPLEVELQQIKEHKANLENKIAVPTDILDKKEYDKVLGDYEEILSSVTNKIENLSTGSEANDKFILFHLPKVLPSYSGETPRGKAIKSEDSEVTITEQKSSSDEPYSLRGQIGQLNIHQSGKISIDLGNQNHLSLVKGADSNFLQEVMFLNVNDLSEDISGMTEGSVKDNIYCIGDIEDKIIATPSFT